MTAAKPGAVESVRDFGNAFLFAFNSGKDWCAIVEARDAAIRLALLREIRERAWLYRGGTTDVNTARAVERTWAKYSTAKEDE